MKYGRICCEGHLLIVSFDLAGLLCLLVDYDQFGTNEKLGAVTIPPKALFDAKGERMEFKLGPPPGKTHEPSGYLAVRCRRASDYDIKFMKKYKESGKTSMLSRREKVVDPTESKGGSGNIRSYFKRQTRVLRDGKSETKQVSRLFPIDNAPHKNTSHRFASSINCVQDQIQRERRRQHG